MLIEDAVKLAMVPNAVSDKTIVVPSSDGGETVVSAKSTILT